MVLEPYGNEDTCQTFLGTNYGAKSLSDRCSWPYKMQNKKKTTSCQRLNLQLQIRSTQLFHQRNLHPKRTQTYHLTVSCILYLLAFLNYEECHLLQC